MPVLAETSATIHYKLARLQTLTEWWHWLALLVAVLAVSTFVVWMYRKDSAELPRGLAILLCLLRLSAFVGILFFFFGLEKRAERKVVKNSRAILLVDTSQSMGLRDSDSSNVPAAIKPASSRSLPSWPAARWSRSSARSTTLLRIGLTRGTTRSKSRRFH